MAHTFTDSCPDCFVLFESWMLDGIEYLVKLGQPRPIYLVREIQEQGAVEATRKLVGKPNPSEGFIRLLLAGLKDRTLEASVLDHGLPCPLFDAALIRVAMDRLGRS